tara:strand:- start:530 stop:922 length:393 start_codon:yes stop_codon:yes gene_type:complete
MKKLIKKVLDDSSDISIATERGRQFITEKIMSAIRSEGGWYLNLNRDNDKPFLYPEIAEDISVLESNANSEHNDGWTRQYYKDKLAEEIVTNQEEGHIFESPDGGKTVYKREFGSKKRTLVKDINDEPNS